VDDLIVEDASYVPYVPVKQRRLGGGGSMLPPPRVAALAAAATHSSSAAASGAGASVPSHSAASNDEGSGHAPRAQSKRSLLEQKREDIAKRGGVEESESERRAAEAEATMKRVLAARKPAALKGAAEHAGGVSYTEVMQSDWTPPAHAKALSEEECRGLRKKWNILAEGEAVPPPLRRFPDMKLPKPIIAALAAKGIERPTPIQVQGLPCALAGRDMVGIAFTGSGKTLVFTLPMVMWALQEELRMPLAENEGPIGLVMCPSRELAEQTYQTVLHFASFLKRSGKYPELRTMLAIGGQDMRTQLAPVRRGVHMVVATPGRLNHYLSKKIINLDLCRYIALDEGDRMLDMGGFNDDVMTTMSFFKAQRQTLIFSATMPDSVRIFAQDNLVKPVVVNVGRAGAANLDVIQEVEYVKEEAKVLYLLECLQKTAPPVIIFTSNTADVDTINEYLLLKGVAAVSIHGGKSQEERSAAMTAFRDFSKDVLIATDVAAKGLDFPNVQHVINFDMPKELENYVHRIGRTGRRGRTGVATTFINKGVSESLLLDLKHLLQEAKQRVPPVLLALDDPEERLRASGAVDVVCGYCGGFHAVQDCEKLKRDARAKEGASRDYLGGEDW
jgi:ATP-dependent RNA helicase DDX41